MNNRIRILFLSLVIFAAGFLIFDYNVRLKTYAAIAQHKNPQHKDKVPLPETQPHASEIDYTVRNISTELEILTELTGDDYEKRIKDVVPSLTSENYETVAKTLLSGKSDVEKKAVAIDLLSRSKNEDSKSILKQYIHSNLYQNSEIDQLLKSQAQEALDHNEIRR